MIVENSLKLLESKSKKYKKNKEIFDIVLYGSIVKSKRKARDIDVLFIFHSLPLEKRLKITQEFKKETKNIENLDIKSLNLDELFSKYFLAKQGVFVEGISLIDKKPFSEKMGFEGFGLFCYETKNLTKTEKVKFFYTLNGRRKEKGFLKKINAEKIGKEAIIVPIKKLELFKEFLEKWNLQFEYKEILISKYK